MPSATWVHRSTIGDLINLYKPKNLLDVGVGFGQMGSLCRDIMDAFQGRIDKDKWRTKIKGIEIFPRYIQAHQQYLYDEIIIDCALRHLEQYSDMEDMYDVIIAGDVVEHFEKKDARRLIDLMWQLASKAVIICIPIGTGYPQGTTCGNTHEAHLSTWEIEEFKNDHRVTRATTVLERIKRRPYGIIVMEKKKG